MAAKVGRDLWSYHPTGIQNVSALCQAAQYSIPLFSNRTKCSSTPPADAAERWWWPLLLYHEGRTFCPSLRDDGNTSTNYPGKSVFPPPSVHAMMPSLDYYYALDDGIAPLGLTIPIK
jgi:hypothetical protein